MKKGTISIIILIILLILLVTLGIFVYNTLYVPKNYVLKIIRRGKCSIYL